MHICYAFTDLILLYQLTINCNIFSSKFLLHLILLMLPL